MAIRAFHPGPVPPLPPATNGEDVISAWAVWTTAIPNPNIISIKNKFNFFIKKSP
jgi:hypothetical protein